MSSREHDSCRLLGRAEGALYSEKMLGNPEKKEGSRSLKH